MAGPRLGLMGQLVLLDSDKLQSNSFKYNKLEGTKHKNSRYLNVTYQIKLRGVYPHKSHVIPLH